MAGAAPNAISRASASTAGEQLSSPGHVNRRSRVASAVQHCPRRRSTKRKQPRARQRTLTLRSPPRASSHQAESGLTSSRSILFFFSRYPLKSRLLESSFLRRSACVAASSGAFVVAGTAGVGAGAGTADVDASGAAGGAGAAAAGGGGAGELMAVRARDGGHEFGRPEGRFRCTTSGG